MLRVATLGAIPFFLLVIVGKSSDAAPLEAHWDFDQVGGPTATDGSGNTRHATLFGSATMVPGGQLGGALSVDLALTSYAEAVGYKGVTGNAARTVTAWIQTANNTQSDMGIVGWADDQDGNGKAWRVRLQPAGGGRLRAEFNNAGRYHNNATNPYDTTFHHIAVSVGTGENRNDVLLYIDGQPVPVVGDGGAGNVAIVTDADRDVLIGLRPRGGVADDAPFNGLIDDTAIFGAQLTSAEILAIYELAVEPSLEYDAGEANELLSVHELGGSVEIDGLLWEFANGLNTGLGMVEGQDGEFSLQLDASGTGVVSSLAAVPEPASIAIWSLIGVGLAGFGYYRTRRKK